MHTHFLQRHPLTLALVVALLGSQTSVTHAQTVTQPTGGAEQGAPQKKSDSPSGDAAHKVPHKLATVTVHGEGHPEQLQRAPAAISVFTTSEIQNAGIHNVSDFVRYVPNMTYDHSFTIGNSFVTMRGIQQINNADAPVAIVVDGVPENNQSEFRQSLFNIKQIEVLRGPQGALYGRNALAGAIVITTEPPSNTTQGFVQGGIGDHGLQKIEATLSGALVKDVLLYRIAASGESFGGSIRNSYTHQLVDYSKNHYFRAEFDWLPTDHQKLALILNNSQLYGGAIYDTSFQNPQPSNTNIFQAPLSNTPGNSHRRINGLTLHYTMDGQGAVFDSITGYTNLFLDYYGDLDFCNPITCPAGLFGLGQADQAQVLHVRELSQEFRLSSPDSSPIQWTAGVYALGTYRQLLTLAHVYPPPSLQPFTIVNSNEVDHNFAWAGFGQASIPLSHGNRIGLSLRYDSDHRKQANFYLPSQVRQATFDAWQPKITFSHDIDKTQMVYATAAKGFRSGGFNGIGGAPFGKETLTSFEAGYKSSWLNHRLTFNTDAFYEIDRGYQFFYIDVAAGGAQVIANLNKVDIYGLESSLHWLVQPGWQLFGSLGLLGSRIANVGAISTTLPIKVGNRAPRTEPYNFVLGSQWNFPLGQQYAMFRADVSREGPRTWEPDNLYVMSPVTLVNARFTYFASDRWSVTLWTRNLFNHRYYADFVPAAFSGLGEDIASPAQGRSYGINVRYEF